MIYPSDHPKVSIVIVVRNAAPTIESAIKSVLIQDYKNFEFIIIDGISTDGTLDIIEKYKAHIAYFSSEKDAGIYDAMNKSLSKCSGDYIYFLGADDELYSPNVLSAIFDKNQYNEHDVLYGDAYYICKKKLRFGKMNRYRVGKHNFNHQTLFYPKSVFNIYSYNTKYKIWADYLLNILLYFKSDYQFRYVNVIISKFNDMGTSGVNNIDFDFEDDREQIIKEVFPIDVYIFCKARNVFLYIQKIFKSLFR
ncbi:Glycosyl transferase family 2 [Pedobacter sp. ok626]|uniref:glycosyltransferase family 2 protein n=1 Tax=Pedobacter sp. ok626 TaxID=1761882 RepID=UPI0008848F4E|nr:glycosyltransferase family 2 protein [Pedobacter sp. ok626]SDK80760.1 Glycosyl transferase family 2 [Pedobacter sp. ok626]